MIKQRSRSLSQVLLSLTCKSFCVSLLHFDIPDPIRHVAMTSSKPVQRTPSPKTTLIFILSGLQTSLAPGHLTGRRSSSITSLVFGAFPSLISSVFSERLTAKYVVSLSLATTNAMYQTEWKTLRNTFCSFLFSSPRPN